jgi:hypothetical protein
VAVDVLEEPEGIDRVGKRKEEVCDGGEREEDEEAKKKRVHRFAREENAAAPARR